LGRKYAETLERKAVVVERGLLDLGERLRKWNDRLLVKESDLLGFVDRHAVRTAEVLVSKARKQPYLDFVFLEREEEGRLSVAFKSVRTTVNRVLERIARAEKWVLERAEANPEHFEVRKTQLLSAWRPYGKRFAALRESVLQQALEFE